MKHHYIILISYYDTKAKRKISENYTFRGTQAQAEICALNSIDFFKPIKTVMDIRCDILRVDTLTHVKTLKAS